MSTPTEPAASATLGTDAVRRWPEDHTLTPVWRVAAAFGGLWGAIELTVGPFLHVVRIPFTGTLLACAGATVLLAARRMCPRRGSTLAAGVVAALCRCLGPGTAIVGPAVGIVMEASVMELVCLVRTRSRAGAAVAGGAAALCPLLQQLAMQRLVYGRTLMELYVVGLRAVARWMHVGTPWVPAVLLVTVPALLGAAAGWCGWQLGGRAMARLAQRQGEASCRSR